MKRKHKLNELKVQSFVTRLKGAGEETVKGGNHCHSWPYYCNTDKCGSGVCTAFQNDCPSGNPC